MSNGIFLGLYDGRFAALLPSLIRQIKARNLDVLTALAGGLTGNPGILSQGMHWSVRCFEEFGRLMPEMRAADRAAHPRLATAFAASRHENAICKAWHPARASESFHEPVSSDIPVLVISGGIDPITPPSFGELTVAGLTNGYHVVFPWDGHIPSTNQACSRRLGGNFFDQPDEAPDTTCLQSVPTINFVTDVYLNPGISRLGAMAAGGDGLGPFLLPLAALLVVLSFLLVWPASALWRKVRRAKASAASNDVSGVEAATAKTSPGQGRARTLAGLGIIVLLGFLVMLALTVAQTAPSNPFLLALGLPGSRAWIAVLPWVALLAALASLVATYRAWRNHWWSGAWRVYFSLVSIALLVLLGWLWRLGFFGI